MVILGVGSHGSLTDLPTCDGKCSGATSSPRWPGNRNRVWVPASAHGVPGLLSKLPFSTVPDTQDNTWTGMGGDLGSWITNFWSRVQG